jgi:uncharacterized damage-inducible protein DinB
MRLMLDLLRDLVSHKGYANAAMLGAMAASEPAIADRDVSALLHHVLLANRFWLLTILGLPFDVAEEARTSDSFAELVARYARLQEQESAWLASATPADLDRVLQDPQIPGGQCSVAQALTQVCMHSHGHRAQCAKLLRRHGAVAPVTDFIWWLAHRPAPSWPTIASPPLGQ